MGVISAITNVFDAMSNWLMSTIPSVTALFYDSTAGTLTFVGVLAVCALGISVFFLIVGLIQRFLHFAG